MGYLCVQNQQNSCKGSETGRIENEAEGCRDVEPELEEFSIHLPSQVYLPEPLTIELTKPVGPETLENASTTNIQVVDARRSTSNDFST